MSSVPRHGYLIVAVPRLRFGYRIELRAYSVSVALICLPIHVYLRVLRNLIVMASTRELFKNMKHVNGPNHVRHFHVGQLAHAEGWNMQACEAHESQTLFGTISTSLSITVGSVPCTRMVRLFLSCHFISIPSHVLFS